MSDRTPSTDFSSMKDSTIWDAVPLPRHLQAILIQNYSVKMVKAVHCAVHGDEHELEKLLHDGLDVTQAVCRALVTSIKAGRRIIDRVGTPASSDRLKLLHVTARYNQLDILRLLIAHGVGIDALAYGSVGDQLFTALAEAAKAGNLEAVEVLLDSGARIDCGRPNATAMADLLVRALDARPQDNFTSQRRTIYDLLLNNGADCSFTEPDSHMQTMELAVRYSQTDLIHDLLRRGVTCKTALKGFVANKSANKALLSLILANGAGQIAEALDPGHVDGLYLSSGRLGHSHGNFQRWGPDRIRQRQQALSLMLDHFRTFTKTPEAVECLMTAARGNDRALVALLVSSGITPCSLGSEGYAALHWAVAGSRSWDSLDWLLKNGAELEQRVVARGWRGEKNAGRTPLILALEKQDPYVVERLLQAGADVGNTCNDGETPLLAMCRYSSLPLWMGNRADPQIEVLRMILDAGSDVRAARWDGKSALHVLAFYFSPDDYAPASAEFVQILLDYGTDPCLRDGDGLLAVDYAARNDPNRVSGLRMMLEACTPDYENVAVTMSKNMRSR